MWIYLGIFLLVQWLAFMVLLDKEKVALWKKVLLSWISAVVVIFGFLPFAFSRFSLRAHLMVPISLDVFVPVYALLLALLVVVVDIVLMRIFTKMPFKRMLWKSLLINIFTFAFLYFIIAAASSEIFNF